LTGRIVTTLPPTNHLAVLEKIVGTANFTSLGDSTMVQLSHVNKQYYGRSVVTDISFEVGKGKTLILLGKSGSGKTTVLKMINRLVEPDSGAISINGKNITQFSKEILRRDIGYVIQATGLFPHYTVAQNISIVPQLLKWGDGRTKARVAELLEKMNLPAEIANRYPHELSGGQQQRVGVARALAANPSLLLMDEPFGALDPLTRKEVQQYFKQLGFFHSITKIIVTHDIREAFLLGDYIALLDYGKIVDYNTPESLLYRSNHPFTRDFLGEELWNLKLSTAKIKVALPFLSLNPSAEKSSLFLDIHNTSFSKVFSLTATYDPVALVEGQSLIGHCSVIELQQAFLKYDNQTSAV